MFVVAGALGKTGRIVAETLIAEGAAVRVFVREAHRAQSLAERGAEVVVGSLADPAALERALDGASGFYAILPEDLAVADFHGHRRAMAAAMDAAIRASGVPHVVLLSAAAATLADGNGPARDLHVAERLFAEAAQKLTVLRACFFQENVFAALEPARRDGIYPSLFAPADVAIPTVATRDVGRLAAWCLLEPPGAHETIDLEGPQYSPTELAEALGETLGRTLHVVEVPAAARVGALVGAGLPPGFAEALAELYACIESGRVRPQGDRLERGATTIEQTLEQLRPRA